ncbi:MAG: type II toxin-antitoxin system HicA family toxin [Gammaproteobacteria bacterium]|nr:type II toxin-antitoxin system HicA family toxin [Gammaproteobacteria bacterium]MDE0257253.1 type II toxin-antitoxin system HicA family toxin [Gammaproteobacteria bacterium]
MKTLSGKGFCRLLESRGWRLRRIRGSHHIYTKDGVAARISVPARRRSRWIRRDGKGMGFIALLARMEECRQRIGRLHCPSISAYSTAAPPWRTSRSRSPGPGSHGFGSQ